MRGDQTGFLAMSPAEKTAKGCPALAHGETVEVIKLGH